MATPFNSRYEMTFTSGDERTFHTLTAEIRDAKVINVSPSALRDSLTTFQSVRQPVRKAASEAKSRRHSRIHSTWRGGRTDRRREGGGNTLRQRKRPSERPF